MERRAELAGQRVRGGDEFGDAARGDEQRVRAEDFLAQSRWRRKVSASVANATGSACVFVASASAAVSAAATTPGIFCTRSTPA